MKKDTALLNDLWAHFLIKELIHHGVRAFCLSPGARSTPLTVAAGRHPLAETFVHYDERGMAYHALGLSKGSRQPVALIVTSGTAVGNLLPAIMEAYHDHVPLIVLTADRPPELRDCGANQTTDQVKIFSNFVQWQEDLPCPDDSISTSYIGTTVAQAMSRALKEPRGPVHLNCMFRKPLLSSEPKSSYQSPPMAQTSLSLGKRLLEEKDMERIADELAEYERGLILVSGTTEVHDLETLYGLSRTLQWPIFPDIFSSVRGGGRGYGVIPYYDLILKAIGAHEDYAPDAILQLGDRFVSAKLTDWIASKKPKVHCHVSPHADRKDHTHCVTHRAQTDMAHFLTHLPRFLSGRPPSAWLKDWKELNRLTSKGVSSYFEVHQEFSEPFLFHALKDAIPPSAALFFSNSMNVRNGEAFFVPESPVGPIYGNRGLSGIDGNIATACGLARGCGKPVIAFLGDLAFLHDLNSLAQLKDLPVKLIIVNNEGGDIFHFLPTGNQTPLFTTPHSHVLKHAAPLFNLPYENPQNLGDMAALLGDPSPLLIEVKTAQGQNTAIHADLLSHLQEISARVGAC
ncbi:MAG: 2-succinyl-5-enolpyruvyl-6-hydroxy-3-cyclohexene-1-carboxylic-acid synthase [Chlamydiia bacterium]|nr:2-succinyl-5-enolpyruvyl-6-hydroxy-3-cyclohexene-1-carboxylic-acid synthase [Chlamydiia bacterium]